MLEVVAPDVSVEPLAAPGRSYSGAEGLRRFFEALREDGTELTVFAQSFDAVGEHVVVAGSLRRRSARGLADRSAAWVLRFDDEARIACIDAFGTRVAAYRALRERAGD